MYVLYGFDGGVVRIGAFRGLIGDFIVRLYRSLIGILQGPYKDLPRGFIKGGERRGLRPSSMRTFFLSFAFT